MKTTEEIIEYLENLAIEKNDNSLYWHKVYKNTKDKSIKKQAKSLSDQYFNALLLIGEIKRFILEEHL